MKKYIRFLSIIILVYSFLFYPIPIFNAIKSFLHGYNIFKVPSFWWNIFLFPIFLLSGIGLYNFNRIARIVWLLFSAYVLFIRLPEIQLLFQGKFFQFYPFSFLDYIEFFGLLGIVIFSLIILNLKSSKMVFKEYGTKKP